jgi:SAM-dependent methyltransferase
LNQVEENVNLSSLFQPPSSRPAGHGITIGTTRFYDLSAALLFGGTRRRTYLQLLLAGGVQPGDRVLDIGCGPGFFARMLAAVTLAFPLYSSLSAEISTLGRGLAIALVLLGWLYLVAHMLLLGAYFNNPSGTWRRPHSGAGAIGRDR